MTADLAKILFFADAEGRLQAAPQRRMFCIVDGIIGGDNKGPLEPDAVHAGCLIAGRNPFAVDLVTARLVGFDVRTLKQFDILSSDRWSFGLRSTSEVDIRLDGTLISGDDFFATSWRDPLYAFKPHPGWKGHIELERRTR